MFKFSFDWLTDYLGKDIKFKEILKILNLQGFEFQGEQKFGEDTVTAIEVKANRPDMLSHMGIAREIKAYCGEKIPKPQRADIKINNESFPIKIKVNDPKACRRFSGIIIKNIDNTVPTPAYIKRRLEALGINLVNAAVDITNYIMLDMGQPMHSYDTDKLIGKEIIVDKANREHRLQTPANKEADIKPGDIIISGSKDVLCIAGIIGTQASGVTEKSRDVLLEGAVFDEIDVRLTSRRLKISTPSSFRFERGVNADYTLDILLKCAQLITEVCGGEILSEAFDFYPNKSEENFLNLSVKNNNRLLGIEISNGAIINYLEKYDFKCTKIDKDIIKVQVPSYRPDVKKEADLIEEVARIHGYDNIEAIMPTIMTQYNKNEIWSKMDVLRSALIGLGFSETVNYSFIPSDSMEIFGIEPGDPLYSDLMLQNPIAGAYSLMRPTMVYSLLNCLAYNYSIDNSNLGLFEFGRVYFKDSNYDTGCREIDTCAFIMSGIRIPRGWGCEKDIKYSYYDLLSYVKILFDGFGQTFDLKQNNYKFCEEGSGYSIVADNKIIGFIGELNKHKLSKIPNVKLIKDKIFYCEFYIKDISERIKKIEFESKYPPVKRLYNLVYKRNVAAAEIINVIKSSSEFIRSVEVKDIYRDKNLSEDKHAVLYEVNYCSKISTLTSVEIEVIENLFLKNLSEKFEACLKE